MVAFPSCLRVTNVTVLTYILTVGYGHATMTEDQVNRRKRLLYQSTHRGTKEADIIIGGFAREKLNSMSTEYLDQFEELLSVSDPDLMLWLNGQQEPDERFRTPVWELIIKFKNKD
ncbi:MAG: succinate dehydrogenase assembly factor 2 [Rhodospirillaceae bacterium]